MLNLIVIATQSSEEYLICLSEKLYSNCTKIGIFKPVENGFAVDYYIKPHTKELIFDWLKNYEAQFRKNNIFVPYKYVARCIQVDDAPILRRDDFEIYTLDYIPIKCPTIVNEENNFIKFQPSISFFSLSPFSLNLFPITITLGIVFLFIKRYKIFNLLKIYKK